MTMRKLFNKLREEIKYKRWKHNRSVEACNEIQAALREFDKQKEKARRAEYEKFKRR